MNENVILMWQALQDGFQFPDTLTQEEYTRLRYEDSASAMKGYAGIVASYSGKWFGGFARDPKGGRNFVREAKENVENKSRFYKT